MEPVAPLYVAEDGDSIAFGVPFTKIDVKNRTVEGFATLDNVDKADDVVDANASEQAFSEWLGNIREMHGPKAVGTAVSIERRALETDGKSYSGIWVKARVSKGAPDTWEKVLDGTLKGFSIGGRVLERRPEVVKDAGRYAERRVTRITKYLLAELSLVDNPMNPLALFDSVNKGLFIKMENDELVAGELVPEQKGLFYCGMCEVAKMDVTDKTEIECVTCDESMVRIGEVSETPTVSELKKMVSAANLEKAAPTKTCPECDATMPMSAAKCPSCGHVMPMTSKADVESPAEDVAGDEPEVLDEESSGFGLPPAGSVPSMENPKPNLLSESGMPDGSPQTDSAGPHAVKAEEALATQTAEGITAEELGNAVLNALKSRGESNGRTRVDKAVQEEHEFIQALLDADMYRAVTNAHKTPPKGYPSDSAKYGDPANHKYPLDTPARVRSAMAYFNAPGQRTAGGYSMTQWASIGRRIASAANSMFAPGHSYSGGRVVGPGMKKSDMERGEFIINLQKNASDGNNDMIKLLHSLVGYLNEDDNSSITKGGDTPTLDVKELEKIFDILEAATREVGEVLKGFNVERLNSEDASGPTVGGNDPGDAGVGTSEANDGGAPMATAEVEVATTSSLAAPDNGPDKVVPNAISTDGTGIAQGVTADSGPEKVLPHADLETSVTATTKSEEVEETKEAANEDLLKAVLTKVEEAFGSLESRLETIEKAGGGKKSVEVGEESEVLQKSDGGSFWGNLFSADELKDN